MDESTPVGMRTGLLQVRRMGAVLFLLMPLVAGAQISLSSAIEMAEKNSPSVRGAVATVQKANAALAETTEAYIPNLVLGISPGYAYGFPLGAPSFFTATSQSLVLSWSQRDYIRAARSGLNSANLNLKDVQQQVALDVALDYVELDHDMKEIASLDEENGYAGSLVGIEQNRVQAGVDPRVTELQAELTAAQVDEKRIQLENDADAMRQKLAHLTGLPAAGIDAISSSIPGVPPPTSRQTAMMTRRDRIRELPRRTRMRSRSGTPPSAMRNRIIVLRRRLPGNTRFLKRRPVIRTTTRRSNTTTPNSGFRSRFLCLTRPSAARRGNRVRKLCTPRRMRMQLATF